MTTGLSKIAAASLLAFTAAAINATENKAVKQDPADLKPAPMQSFPLYGTGPIPNSKTTPNEETTGNPAWIQKVSQPQIQVYLPAKAKAKATGASVLIFPGGAYAGLSFDYEGVQQANYFVDHGIAAFVVKYRLPSDVWMVDKSIGPLQDAQQAMLFARTRAKDWNLDSNRIGAIGFSAGGHLAATLATRFNQPHITNPSNINLRPDFLVLVYPVISMQDTITHLDSRKALLGDKPTQAQIKLFSNELQVSANTPPSFLLHAVDDTLVDVKNSLLFIEALKNAGVPVDAQLFAKGEHGFFPLPRERWQAPIVQWLNSNGWLQGQKN